MQFTKSITTLVASLMVLLLYVLSINSVSSKPASADNELAAIQEGNFNPIEGEQEEEEGDEIDDDFDEGDEDEFDEGDEFGEEDEEWYDGESEYDHLEFRRMEVEANVGRVELMKRLAEIAKDDVTMASYAIMNMEELIGSEDEKAIATIKELIASSNVAKPVKNLLKMKLAEMYSYSDQEDKAMEVLKSMIIEE